MKLKLSVLDKVVDSKLILVVNKCLRCTYTLPCLRWVGVFGGGESIP
uniref:Uncharacterized protein n=1 Tax=Anguilla anguilla TaxID=7936 RepID=A0A0E9RET5_ANGAN